MKISDIRGTYTLHNGIAMPYLGLGVFLVDEGNEVVKAVRDALAVGYRHIDTASLYGNERGVGRAIAASGIPRKEIFVTSKVWNSDQGYDSTLRAFEKSLKLLGFEYLDLYSCTGRSKGNTLKHGKLLNGSMPKAGSARSASAIFFAIIWKIFSPAAKRFPW